MTAIEAGIILDLVITKVGCQASQAELTRLSGWRLMSWPGWVLAAVLRDVFAQAKTQLAKLPKLPRLDNDVAPTRRAPVTKHGYPV